MSAARSWLEWNDTAAGAGRARCRSCSQAQAAPTPHAVAVVSGDAELTYERAQRAGEPAGAAADRARCGPGEPSSALALPRSAELVVAVLAVVKAGGAYLPVDPGYPAQRIGYMLADAAPVLRGDHRGAGRRRCPQACRR